MKFLTPRVDCLSKRPGIYNSNRAIAYLKQLSTRLTLIQEFSFRKCENDVERLTLVGQEAVQVFFGTETAEEILCQV